MDIRKVIMTEAAREVLEHLRERYGPLMFHQSGGCCDGSSPMCFELGDFKVGNSDVLVDYVEGCPFYIARDQYEYWKFSQLIIDVSPGRGASFSLEIPLGVRFMVKSRLFTDEEWLTIEGNPDAEGTSPK